MGSLLVIRPALVQDVAEMALQVRWWQIRWVTVRGDIATYPF